MYRKLLYGFMLVSLSGCGHYGALYFPENAALHKHHPPKSKTPTTAVTAKQTEEYQNIDQLTIPEIINAEETDTP